MDEAQNISKYEFNLLEKLHKEPKFNIYGDINQKIYKNMGLKNWDDVVSNYSLFTLQENYRNPKNVVDFCNDALNLNMKALGVIEGDVYTVDEDAFDLIDDCVYDYEGNVVIIVKNESVFESFEEIYQGDYELHYVEGEEYQYSEDVINVFSLYTVIGMEFQNVMVYMAGMDEQELYIAYTRTLNDVICIETSEKI